MKDITLSYFPLLSCCLLVLGDSQTVATKDSEVELQRKVQALQAELGREKQITGALLDANKELKEKLSHFNNSASAG